MGTTKEFNMKKIFVYLCVLLGVAFFGISLYAGGEKEAATAEPEEIEIEFMMLEDDAPIALDSVKWEALRKKTGVKIIPKPHPSAGFEEKFWTLCATNNLPDLADARGTTPKLAKYARQGVFLEITPYLDIMPNYKKWLDTKPRLRSGYMDGKVYNFMQVHAYKVGDVSGRVPMIRKDLMDETGLGEPETFDDLYRLLKKIKQLHPELIIWTRRGNLTYTFFNDGMLFNWGTGKQVYYDYDLKKWKFGPIMPQYRTALQWYRKLYSEGLIDPEDTHSSKWIEKWSTGKAAFTWDNGDKILGFSRTLPKNVPGAAVTFLKAIKNPWGQARLLQYADHRTAWGSYVASSKVKYPEKLVKMFDYMYSEEGMLLTNWGIEGEYYTMVGGEPKLTQKYVDKYKDAFSPWRNFQYIEGLGKQSMFTVAMDERVANAWITPLEVEAKKYWITLAQQMYEPAFSEETDEKRADLFSNLKNIYQPMQEKVMAGKADLSDWDAVVEQMKKAGAEELEQIYNEAWAKTEWARFVE